MKNLIFDGNEIEVNWIGGNVLVRYSEDTNIYFKETFNDKDDNSDAENPLDDIESSETANGKTYKYKGFDVAGTIEIPKTNIKHLKRNACL